MLNKPELASWACLVLDKIKIVCHSKGVFTLMATPLVANRSPIVLQSM